MGVLRASYEVTGIKIGDRVLTGYGIDFRSETGLVRYPKVETAYGRQGVTWQPCDSALDGDFEAQLESERRLRGLVQFKKGAALGEAGYGFRLDLTMVNAEPMSDWEYHLMYGPGGRTGRGGEPPTNELAYPVWCPVKELILTVKLPEKTKWNPYVDIFGDDQGGFKPVVDASGTLMRNQQPANWYRNPGSYQSRETELFGRQNMAAGSPLPADGNHVYNHLATRRRPEGADSKTNYG